MKTIVEKTAPVFKLSAASPAALAFARPRRRFALAVLALLTPFMFLTCFKATQALLGNEAFASVSDDYMPAALFGNSDAARSARILHDRVLRDPQRINALDVDQIVSLFDRPDLRRIEGPYRHWQYVSSSCVMDIYMKLGNGEKTAHPVQYIDFRPRRTAYYQPVKNANGDAVSSDAVDRSQCIGSLARRNVASARDAVR